MSSQVCRVQGFSKGSLAAIGNEAERGNVNHRNGDIDTSLSVNNVAFKETHHGFYAEWNDIKSTLNASFNERKGAVAFEGMVITAEQKFFRDSFGWEQGQPMTPAMKRFFEDSYKWALEYIGYRGTDRNVLSAVVHLDETTPHLQLYYLPVTEKWREKVYAKGEDGKVLRTDRGTPVQAKDEHGKTIFREVEDLNAPKLARTEFWQQRGGQSSYREMQDSYHEQVGRKYGLERGDVGSDRKHKTKAQHEYEQLEETLQPRREQAAVIQRVETTGKHIPILNMEILKTSELETLKEQAAQAAFVQERQKELDRKNNFLIGREIRSRDDLAYIERREDKLIDELREFERQRRKLHERTAIVAQHEREVEHLRALPAENAALKTQIASLEEQVRELTTENRRLTERLAEAAAEFKKKLRSVYYTLTDVVQTVGMLKYDKSRGYRVENLTARQGKLIDVVAEFAAKFARQDGHEDLAESMEKRVAIPPDIREMIEPPAPAKPTRPSGPVR